MESLACGFGIDDPHSIKAVANVWRMLGRSEGPIVTTQATGVGPYLGPRVRTEHPDCLTP